MILVTCFECGRRNVISSGVCPECHRSPLPGHCTKCGDTVKRSKLVEMVCARCRAEISQEGTPEEELSEAGYCRGCSAPIAIGRLPTPALHDEVWTDKCPQCDRQLEWDRCGLCRGVFFGPLTHVKWVEQGYGGYGLPRDLCVCDACLPLAEHEKAACLAANARIDSDLGTMAVLTFAFFVPLTILLLFLINSVGRL